MKLSCRLSLMALSALIVGCQPQPDRDTTPEATISGETISLPPGTPQLGALRVEPVGFTQGAMVSLTGRLVWNEETTVRVFSPFGGRVRRVRVELGATVPSGAPLVELESPDFGQAQAEARKAQGDLRLAERNLSRLRDLVAHGAAARKDLELAEADQTRAAAEKDRALNRLGLSAKTGEQVDQVFVLPSPLAGTVVEKNLTPGQEVRADQMLANAAQFTAPLFVVTEPNQLWVWLDATEMHLPLLRAGQPLYVRTKAFPDEVFAGELDIIGASLDPVTRTVKVRGHVDNRSRLLKAEMYVMVEAPDAAPRSLQAPAKAVFLQAGHHFVFVEAAPGRFRRTAVKPGAERDGKVVLEHGVRDGERVVTEGALLLESLLGERAGL